MEFLGRGFISNEFFDKLPLVGIFLQTLTSSALLMSHDVFHRIDGKINGVETRVQMVKVKEFIFTPFAEFFVQGF